MYHGLKVSRYSDASIYRPISKQLLRVQHHTAAKMCKTCLCVQFKESVTGWITSYPPWYN